MKLLRSCGLYDGWSRDGESSLASLNWIAISTRRIDLVIHTSTYSTVFTSMTSLGSKIRFIIVRAYICAATCFDLSF